jgi:hypothetical protein
LIIVVDNRAAEIGRDTGCPVVARDDQAGIRAWIEGSEPLQITLPTEAIDTWRGQFVAA